MFTGNCHHKSMAAERRRKFLNSKQARQEIVSIHPRKREKDCLQMRFVSTFRVLLKGARNERVFLFTRGLERARWKLCIRNRFSRRKTCFSFRSHPNDFIQYLVIFQKICFHALFSRSFKPPLRLCEREIVSEVFSHCIFIEIHQSKVFVDF